MWSSATTAFKGIARHSRIRYTERSIGSQTQTQTLSLSLSFAGAHSHSLIASFALSAERDEAISNIACLSLSLCVSLLTSRGPINLYRESFIPEKKQNLPQHLSSWALEDQGWINCRSSLSRAAPKTTASTSLPYCRVALQPLISLYKYPAKARPISHQLLFLVKNKKKKKVSRLFLFIFGLFNYHRIYPLGGGPHTRSGALRLRRHDGAHNAPRRRRHDNE